MEINSLQISKQQSIGRYDGRKKTNKHQKSTKNTKEQFEQEMKKIILKYYWEQNI